MLRTSTKPVYAARMTHACLVSLLGAINCFQFIYLSVDKKDKLDVYLLDNYVTQALALMIAEDFMLPGTENGYPKYCQEFLAGTIVSFTTFFGNYDFYGTKLITFIYSGAKTFNYYNFLKNNSKFIEYLKRERKKYEEKLAESQKIHDARFEEMLKLANENVVVNADDEAKKVIENKK